MLRIATALTFASAIPVMAGEWYILDPGVATYLDGDWVATCRLEPNYECETVAYSDDGDGPGQIRLMWEPWGDEGYSFQFFSTRAPKAITGIVTVTIDDVPQEMVEMTDYFPLAGEDTETVQAISIGEPFVVVEVIKRMRTGKTLVWDWGTGQLTVPLAGFAGTFEAVTEYRKELGQ